MDNYKQSKFTGYLHPSVWLIASICGLLLLILLWFFPYLQPGARAEVDTVFVAFADGYYEYSDTESRCGPGNAWEISIVAFGSGFGPDTSVRYSVIAGGSPAATPDLDFAVITNSEVPLEHAGATSISVPLLCDLLDEPDEQFQVFLSPGEGGVEVDETPATITILDDDIPTASINAITVPERDNGDMDQYQLEVSLSIEPYQAVTLQYVAVADTATENDFSVPNGSLIFQAGVTNRPLFVTIKGDDIDEVEDLERFFIELSSTNPEDIDVANGERGEVYIQDNDHAGITISPRNLMTVEDGSLTGSFRVHLNTQPLVPVLLELSSSDPGEGLPDKNSLTFTADNWQQSQQVIVSGIQDDMRDCLQQFYVVLDSSNAEEPVYKTLMAETVKVKNWDSDGACVFSALSLADSGSTLDFRDDFENPNSRSIYLVSFPTAEINNGKFILQQLDKNLNIRAIAQINKAPVDYAVEVEVRVLPEADDYTRVGLIFDYLDEQRFYRFVVEPLTRRYIVQRFEGGWNDISDGLVYSEYINGRTETNVLRLERRDGNLKIFVNRVEIANFYDNRYLDGLPGLIVIAPPDMADGDDATAAFDNLHVYELND